MSGGLDSLMGDVTEVERLRMGLPDLPVRGDGSEVRLPSSGFDPLVPGFLKGLERQSDRDRFEAMVLNGGPPVSIDSGGLGIVTPRVARGLPRLATRIPADPRFLAAIENTPGARLEEDGVLTPVLRYQHPDQAGGPVTRSGVFYGVDPRETRRGFYAPEGMRYRGADRRPATWGGEQEIAGETLLRAPLPVRASFANGTSEAAMRELESDAHSQKLLREAFGLSSVLRDRSWDLPRRLSYLRNVLQNEGGDERFAPHMMRFADDPAGQNRLWSAIYENIVGAKARRAGYDSVVGIGLRRPHRLREVWDLREDAFPDPSDLGAVHVHPRYRVEGYRRGGLVHRGPKCMASGGVV
jgi:hypothetical protein